MCHCSRIYVMAGKYLSICIQVHLNLLLVDGVIHAGVAGVAGCIYISGSLL